jgi:uncharacterized membrane-anchored protein YhcB (DUF1043 family)
MSGLFIGLFVGIIVGIIIGRLSYKAKLEDSDDTNYMLSNEILNQSKVLKSYRSKFGYDEESENKAVNNNEINGGNE